MQQSESARRCEMKAQSLHVSCFCVPACSTVWDSCRERRSQLTVDGTSGGRSFLRRSLAQKQTMSYWKIKLRMSRLGPTAANTIVFSDEVARANCGHLCRPNRSGGVTQRDCSLPSTFIDCRFSSKITRVRIRVFGAIFRIDYSFNSRPYTSVATRAVSFDSEAAGARPKTLETRQNLIRHLSVWICQSIVRRIVDINTFPTSTTSEPLLARSWDTNASLGARASSLRNSRWMCGHRPLDYSVTAPSPSLRIHASHHRFGSCV
eukprot:284815668_1